MTTFAKRERFAIAQTLRNLGPDAPTLCSDWKSFDLLAHLVNRENRPDSALGLIIPAFSSYSNKIATESKNRGFENLVKEFEDGPKIYSPFSIPGVDRLANTFEFLVHHEDLLRGESNYTPRVISEADKKFLWKQFTRSAKFFMLKAQVGIVAKSDQGTYTVKTGNNSVTISGEVVDLILFAFGRKSAAQVEFTGDESAINTLKQTKFGF